MRFTSSWLVSFLRVSGCSSLLGGLVLGAQLSGCKSTPPPAARPPEPVILKVGDKAFTTDEFFQSFTKNQISGDSSRRTDIRDYFGLYTNLKLKVVSAEQEGRDTTEGFREEMATYRKQLAQSYLNDKFVVENLTAEAYERLKQEANISHILLSVPEDALPADTAKAYEAALDIRRRVLAGEDFSQLARRHSNDPTVANNGGNLGFMAAFQLVYPLETAAFTTPIGGVSMPVRTRSGYHLINVLERRPSRSKIRVAHILVRVSPSAAASGSAGEGQRAAKARIDEVYNRLQQGEPFEALAREFSDDRESRNTGGVLPIFGTGSMVQPFEEAAYALTEIGSYSRPFQTNYGWHIVRLMERQPLESFETLAPALRQKVITDTRGEIVRASLVQRLRQEYPVRESAAILQKTLALGDSALLAGKWKVPTPLEAALANQTLVTVNQQPYTTDQFLEFVARRQQPRPAGSSALVVMERLFRRFVDDKLIEQEEAALEKKHPDFRVLMNDIRDGVLLSQVMETNVWEKSLADSVGQRRYYEQNKDKYRYEQRAAAALLVAKDETILKQASEMLAKSPYQLRRTVKELTFPANQSQLTTKHREDLFDLLVILIKNPDYLVEVAGSADTPERDSISAGRIRNVVSYLTANRIPIMRIMEKDHGKFRPGSAGKGEPARRVTFQLFSTSRRDVEKILNGKSAGTDPQQEKAVLEPAVTITDGLFARGSNPFVDAVEWTPGVKTVKLNGKVAQVTIERIEPPRVKTFEEARGAVINDYQAQLEKQWLEGLKQRYPVQVNDEEVRKLVK